MEILYLLIPVSVILVFVIGLAFWWSVKSGQYDDLDGPGYRVLMDDDEPGKRQLSAKKTETTKETPETES